MVRLSYKDWKAWFVSDWMKTKTEAWERKVEYSEFCNAFDNEDLLDLYSQYLIGTLDQPVNETKQLKEELIDLLSRHIVLCDEVRREHSWPLGDFVRKYTKRLKELRDE